MDGEDFKAQEGKTQEGSKARERWSVVADFISTFITTIIVIVAVVIVVIRVLGWNMYSVDSYSMTPAYPINSLVVVKTVEPETIQVGDVITYVFNEDGVLVTHRVTEIDYSNRTFTTKGDANDTADASPVLWDNVAGKVVAGIPGLGAPLRVLTAEKNRPIVIAVIVGLLVVSFGWDIVSGRKKKRTAKQAVEGADSGDDSAGKSLPDTEKRQDGTSEEDIELEYIHIDDKWYDE